jgi:hypothetical protein
METPIIIGVESNCESGFSVTARSLVVNRSVKSKNVVSIPSVQDILITYSEVVLTSILEFSDKIKAASENECTSYKMKKTPKIPQMTEQF